MPTASCTPTVGTPGLLKLFSNKGVSVPIYLSLTVRTDPREQAIQVAKTAQEIYAKQSQ